MGYPIRAYSLKELHRISVPGTVVPSLFWLMPVGRWQRWQLDPLWHHFVHEEGACRDVGLMLAKNELQQNRQGDPSAELGNLGAQLLNVIPSGAHEYLQDDEDPESPSLLFFSGAYPQPGWGVLIRPTVSPDLPSEVEHFVQQATTSMGEPKPVRACLDAIKEATRCFHDREQAGAVHIPIDIELRRRINMATGYQWDYGPRFLWALQLIAARQGLACCDVVWDPARMIGWKLWANGCQVTVEDLHQISKEILKGTFGSSLRVTGAAEVANGSFFTDYVHYLASQNTTESPRKMAVRLLERLLRPAETRHLLDLLKVECPDGWDTAERCNRLVDALGWREGVDVPNRSLASCFQCKEDGTAALADVGYNEVRIAAEGFCKDLIDLMVSRLSLDQAGVWELVRLRCPNYRPSHSSWTAEVRFITLGPASMLITVLARECFDEQGDDVNALVEALQQLQHDLNPLSHHQEDPKKWQKAAVKVAPALRDLMAATHRLVGEMPWHFQPIQNVGTHPCVLTGKGWNHSDPQERMVRVLLWTGDRFDEKDLIWNPTLINPIMVDPVVVRRPQ